jgi:protein-disulfide isomerase
VRIVYRDFPLPNHPMAMPAAEAAQCAHAQGKFWEYHDRIFASQRELSPEKLRQLATETGLDTQAFGACLDSGQFRNDIQQDHQQGQQAGVSGTPAFFVNGRFLSGAQPFEVFQLIIEEELRR